MSTKQKLLSKIVISFGFPAVLLVGWIFKDSVLHTKLTDNNDPSVSITTTDGDSVLIPTTLYNKLDSALVVLDEPMREPGQTHLKVRKGDEQSQLANDA